LLMRFWGPALENPRPIMITLATPIVYRLDDEVFERFGAHDAAAPGLLALHPPDDGVIYGREVVPDAQNYVGLGDTLAVTRLAILFGRLGKNCQVRTGSEVSFADLRDSSAVLVGAFSNTWTMELMKEWRFVFEVPEHWRWIIRDRTDPSRFWEDAALHDRLSARKPTEDYALISRVFEQRSGQPVVSVAGIMGYGTAAAAEFLSDPALLATSLQAAPKDWYRKNLQIVIHTQVIGSTSGTPSFVARHIW
jgi:hypothetical protein